MKWYPVDPEIFKQGRVFATSTEVVPSLMFSHLRSEVAVFYAITSEEQEQLRTLVRQTRDLTAVCGRTGMYVIDTFTLDGYEVACFSLRKELVFSDDERERFRKTVRAKVITALSYPRLV